MSKIILASTSPRRKELLERESIDFIIDASCLDEVLDESLEIKKRLEKLAFEKGNPIHQKYPLDTVISADTVVYHHGKVIGKPKDSSEAIKILNELSDETQIVYTAVSIWSKDRYTVFTDETSVTFKNIETMIPDYIHSYEWEGKAGAYAIQGIASIFIDEIEGDIDTVIGLPVKKVKAILEEWKII